MFTHNTTTGYTPFELMYEYKAILPTALIQPPKLTYSYDCTGVIYSERIRVTNRITIENAKQVKNKMKKTI